MKNEKVATIEDRIPKLKQQRKQKANRRMIFYISFFFILILIIVYFQSPLSNVKTIEIKGNQLIPEDRILSQLDFSTDTSYWSVDPVHVESQVRKIVQVKSVEVDKVLPNKVIITVTEYDKVAFLENDGKYLPLLQNGEPMPQVSKDTVPSNAPILVKWEDEDAIKLMAEELTKLSESVRLRISELHHTPLENDSQHITLYMNDGYEVQSRIPNFAEYMQYYPSIVDKLDGNLDGVIYMSKSPRFEAFDTGEEEGEEQTENEG
ncbi:cell division protein FtsQ/DivIB [Pseudalkalibacillus salsuginis]|uniref:cell division protein FtsQ/DivIB n=1 Tax=Pseudalkalibacillus salsuginis TaxID=2910972 RepID=UPI001F3AA2E1|nr:FtsQ-type POTRA domain-containing protein [Pseudalkalibacillus salsuginis]MCF6410472.1 FtsQ-type POTRA domain-containing protein [Pseudalkalibacillus salsuginis]